MSATSSGVRLIGLVIDDGCGTGFIGIHIEPYLLQRGIKYTMAVIFFKFVAKKMSFNI